MAELKLIYLRNPDPILFNTMDQDYIDRFRQQNVEVLDVHLHELFIKIQTNQSSLYRNNEPINVKSYNAFFYYGFCSPHNYSNILYLIQFLEVQGVAPLHNHETLNILNNKLLQAFRFSKHQIPFPDSGYILHKNQAKNMIFQHFDKECVVKTLSEYCGNGVSLARNGHKVIELYHAFQWKNEDLLIQKFVKDSVGVSIRVIVLDDQVISISKFSNLTGDFRSNNQYEPFAADVALDDQESLQKYGPLGINAVKSLGCNLQIGGVDILDS